MQTPLEKLKEKVFGSKANQRETELTSIIQMAREFSCLGEITGREFEILDKFGNVVYFIRQKPMAIKQMRHLMREFITIKHMDEEREAKKFGGKKGGKGIK